MAAAVAAVGSILSIGIGSATVGSILAYAAVSVATSALAQSFVKKPSRSGAVMDAGLNVNLLDPNAAFPLVFGRTQFAGIRRFHETSNANRWLHMMNVYAGHEIDAVEKIIVDGNEVSVDADGWATGTYAGHLRVKVYLGTDDDPADPYFLDHAPSYTASMRGRGICKAFISCKWNTDLFPQEPNVILVMRGAKVYDPRDETQDMTDPSTWKWTRNGILNATHYMRGMPKMDHTGNLRRLFGTNAKDAQIKWSDIPAEANICDEAVALAEGGTQPRYTIDGIVFADGDPRDTLDSMMRSCAGSRIDSAGMLSLRAGAPRTPGIVFDHGDLIGPIAVRVAGSMSELYNGVKGQYRGPDGNYVPDDVPTFLDSSLVTLDGGRENWLDLPLEFTDNAAAAQRIQRIALAENRRQKNVVLPMSLKAMKLQPGDWFGFTSPGRGWDNKSFVVSSWKFAPVEDNNGGIFLGVNVEAKEVDSGIWPWNSGDQTIVLPAPSTNLPNPLIISAPTMLEPEFLVFRDRALYRFAATPASDGPPVKYRFEYRIKGASVWTVLADRDEPDVTVFLDIGVYEARVRSVAQPYGGQSPYSPSSAGLEFTVGKPPLTPRVTGLELVGGGPNNTFTGRDAIFQWRQGRVGAVGLDNPLGADVDQQDLYFVGYRIEVRSLPEAGYPSGKLMRTATITDARFEYTFEMNYRDATRLGFSGAQRAFSLTVMQMSRYGGETDYSLPLTISVINPAPTLPYDLNVRTLFSELRVSFTAPTDPDFEGGIVWASETDGFDPADVPPLFIGRDNIITFELGADKTWYVRFAAYDAFIGEYDATDVSLLNISPQITVETQSLDVDIPAFSFLGLNVRPNSGGTGLVWDAGSAGVVRKDGATQYAIAAGTASWTSGTLYLYYREGQTVLQTATSLAGAQFSNSYVLALYQGGNHLTVGDGGVYTDGGTIIARSIGAQQIVTGSAVITEGAQIASAIITDAKIVDLAADKLKANTGIVNKLYVGEDQLIEIDGASGSQRITFYEDA